MRAAAKVGIFIGLLWSQQAPLKIVVYEDLLDRYFRIREWSSANALAKPDTIRFLKLAGKLPPLPNLPRLEALYLSEIEELNLSVLVDLINTKCPALRVLALEACDIDDLGPLQQLKVPLKGLLLDQNDIKDFTALVGFTKLEFLSLGETSFSQPEILQKLPNLQALDLRQTPIRSLAFLESCRGLQALSLYRCSNLMDLSPILAHASSLAFLNLSFTNPTAAQKVLSKLGSFSNLKVLQAQSILTDTQAAAQLGQLSQLEELTIGQNPTLRDISFVKDLSRLLYLDIHSCQISDLTPLSGHPSLLKLIIAHNPITRLAPLKGCPQLADLYCYNIPAKDWEVLLELPNLSHVMLSKKDLPAEKRESLLVALRRKGVRVDAAP